jgi:PAS domain S-box-containing protein
MRLVYSGGAPRPARRARGAAHRYQALFEHTPAALVLTDASGVVVDVNPAACSLFALDSQAFLGRPLVELVAPRARGGVRAFLAQVRFRPRSATADRLRLRILGRPVEAAVALLPDTGDEAAACWSLRDDAALKRAETRLRRAQAGARASLRKWRERAKALASRSLAAREEEARRIAHALHDEAGQVTASAGLILHQLEPDLPARLRPRFRRALALVIDVEERLRGISHELRPTLLDDLGFGAALGFLAESFSSRTSVEVDVRGEIGDARLDAAGATALYRVTQEALSNVARHAGARRVLIELRRRRGSFRYVVRDDGLGFEPAHAGRNGGLGLLSMRERLEALGGSLVVRSTGGRGTALVATLPAGRRRSPAGS